VPGGDVNFTITVTNEGNTDATDATIADIIPTGLELKHAGDGTRSLGLIVAGSSKSVTIPFKIKDNFQGTSITNCVQINAANNAINLDDRDSTPGNSIVHEDDYDCADLTVTQTFDLALIKKSTVPAGTIINLGTDVTFEITVINQGTLDATDVNISDYIPNGLILNDADWTQAGNTATYNQSFDVPKGASQTVSITFTVDPNFQGDTITNWAEITDANNSLGRSDKDSNTSDRMCMPADIAHNDDTSDTNGCDDIDPEVIRIGQYFDLALIKKRVGALTRTNGDAVTFNITVYNQGTLDATNIQINDYLPSGLTLHDSNWRVANGTATLKTPITSIPKGTSKTISITLTIDEDVGNKYLINNAEIASADNNLNKPDADSTPGSEDGSTPDANDNDTADVGGMDDYDPAVVKVKPTAVDSDTHTPSTSSDTEEEECECENVKGNKANAMGLLALMLMLLVTLAMAVKFLPQDDDSILI
jgi:uncharacterized repeat protein (TIGR01451 family)